MSDNATQGDGSRDRRNLSGTSNRQPHARQMERLLVEIVGALPALDKKAVGAALDEIGTHPRASLHYLLEQLTSADPAARSVAGFLLQRHGGADVVDDLNGLIFDAAQEARTKIAANDILAQLDHPVDPDVFLMSVPDAEELQKELPSLALRLLAEGDVEAAAAHARSLAPADRSLVLHLAAARQRERAPALLQALARDDEATTTAVVSTIGAEQMEECVPLLLDLQRKAGRSLQKLIKRILFDLRKAGIEIPEEKQPIGIAVGAKVRDGELPVYCSMMGEPSPQGAVLVVVARERPSGRLKVFSVIVDYWKRGVGQAVLRSNMSRSSCDRFIASQPNVKEASIAECRRAVARGLRVAREFGSPIPLDLGLGKSLLGDVDAEAAAIADPFPCSSCGKSLDAETLERIRSAAPYHHMQVETRCATCRKSEKQT